MKLLRIALNLETHRTKDYAEQLATNLLLTSPFSLCQTIHIVDRNWYDDDDDDDDDDNGDSKQEMQEIPTRRKY